MRYALVGGAVVLAALPVFATQYVSVLATEMLVLGLFALSFNLLFGYTGLLSFGHAAYFAVGGYVTALLLVRGWPLVAAVVVAVVAATIAAAALGWLSVRRDEIYFSMLTLAWGMMVFTAAFQWRDVTGGSDGITNLPIGRVAGIDLADFRIFYLVTLAIVSLSAYLLWRITRSPFGAILVATRENAERVAFTGIDVRHHQIAAFVIAGFFAGIAGALFTVFARIAAPSMAHWTRSAEPVLMTILGGSGTFLGPLVGAAVFIYLRDLVTAQTEFWNLVLGLILVPIVLLFRGGIVGFLLDVRRDFAGGE
jgi:branched-chain amino acid transport system permease protein